MAKMKHNFDNWDDARKAFDIGRRNKDGDVILGNNTVLREIVGLERTDYAVRLHNTNVVYFYADGRIGLNSGGFYSMTTADRMQTFTPWNVRINRRKGDYVLSFMLRGVWEEQDTFNMGIVIL